MCVRVVLPSCYDNKVCPADAVPNVVAGCPMPGPRQGRAAGGRRGHGGGIVHADRGVRAIGERRVSTTAKAAPLRLLCSVHVQGGKDTYPSSLIFNGG